METTDRANDVKRPTVPESVLRHLLTAERVVMALVLLSVGVSGCVSLLGSLGKGDVAAASPIVTGAFMKAGFMYPLLKGTEILLELWIAAQRGRDGMSA